jgi:hypothetical protein
VFGSVPVGSVDTLTVKRWVAEMRAAGKGGRTIQGAVVTLSQVLGAAVDGGALRTNPARGLRRARGEAQ